MFNNNIDRDCAQVYGRQHFYIYHIYVIFGRPIYIPGVANIKYLDIYFRVTS